MKTLVKRSNIFQSQNARWNDVNSCLQKPGGVSVRDFDTQLKMPRSVNPPVRLAVRAYVYQLVWYTCAVLMLMQSCDAMMPLLL